MNHAYQSAMSQAADQTGAPPLLLDAIKDRLATLHKVTTELHDFANRLVGIRDCVGPQKVSPAPCGLLGEIAESVDTLQDRLEGLYERLSRV